MPPEIGNLDEWLLLLTEGLPLLPKHYELHCHPDVFLALRQASDEVMEWPPAVHNGTGLYGSAAVTVHPELGSGGWELYEGGELLKRGRLGASATSLPVP